MAATYLIPTLIFLLFCITHSLFASTRFKEHLFRKAAWLKPWYRLLYNLLALILFAIWYFSLPPDRQLYSLPNPYFSLLIAMQLLVAGSAGYLFLKSSGGGLTGITQLSRYVRSGEMPDYLDEPARGSLNRSGLYGYVRHPVYSLVMLILIASPIMSLNLLYITLSIALYFIIGTYFEERNLINRFGEEYRRYQKEVPAFVPNPIKLWKKR